jgi:hypothetical protein
MPKVIAPLLALASLGLVACDAPPKEQQRAEPAPEGGVAEARRAAEEHVRVRLRILNDMQLRAVQVYSQQVPDTFAVCGQINPTGAADDPFIPWVAVVTLRDDKATRTDLPLGAWNTKSSRVYSRAWTAVRGRRTEHRTPAGTARPPAAALRRGSGAASRAPAGRPRSDAGEEEGQEPADGGIDDIEVAA